MKKQILKFGTAAVALALVVAGGTGCNKIKDFGTTNDNLAGTPNPVTAALLTNVMNGFYANYAGVARSSYYAQYRSETQYPDASLYSAPIVSFGGTYSGDLYDLQNIIIQNTTPSLQANASLSGGPSNQIAVARILKAYIFWQLTDRYGDIPYSEALKGTAIPLPKYDKQETIYPDLIKELKEAVAQFDNNQPVFKGDIIMNYAGTGSAAAVNLKWKKFANSLRMMMALRLSKVFPAAGGYAATEFNAALADANGSISTNADNVVQTYPNGTFPNPWYNTYVVSGRVDDAESKTVTDYLNANNDPRVKQYGTQTTGFPYGLDRPTAITIPTSTISLILKGKGFVATDNMVILNAATVLLTRAEAAARGWTTENYATLYAQGVTASVTQPQYGNSAADAVTLLAQPGMAITPANAIQQIVTQKWLALYPDGQQAWSEWRRTGFPILTPAPYASNTTKQIPRRYIYGTDDYALNAANVKAAAALISGGDTQDGRVWWDK